MNVFWSGTGPCCLLGVTLFAVTFSALSAAVAENPYRDITARNLFQLRPVSPKTEPVVPPEPLPPIDVRLTGITDVSGRKLALLEILEPGLPVKKPILAEGDFSGVVELLRIDPGGNRVQLRVRGVETNLTFPAGKSADGPPTPRLTSLLPRRS